MITEEVKRWPMAQKIQVMEAIWEDLRDRFDRVQPSPRVQDLLDLRRARVREGVARVLDWESVKSTIGRA